MQNDSNVEKPQAENNISTAVLTPHLNHPNFSGGSDYCKRCNYAHKKERNHWYHGLCLTMKENFVKDGRLNKLQSF